MAVPDVLLMNGFWSVFIVIGSWMSGPLILVGLTILLALAGDWFAAVAVPAFLVMYKLPKPVFRASFWAALTAFCAATSGLRLFYALVVSVLAIQVMFDLETPPWEGFLHWMDITLSFKSYFQHCELRGALDTVKGEKSIFAYHPHGATSVGFTVNGLFDESFIKRSEDKGVSFVIDDFLRYGNPVFRFFCDMYRTPKRDIRDASRRTLTWALSSGRNIAMTLGGFEEASLCLRGKDRVIVKSRKGIIKYCLKYGYRIHPIYTFGEDYTYYYVDGALDLRLKLNQYKIPTVAFFGNPWLPILPLRSAKLLTFVGEPVQMPLIEEPTQADIDKWHQIYIDALVKLFDSKKAEAGRPDAKLELF